MGSYQRRECGSSDRAEAGLAHVLEDFVEVDFDDTLAQLSEWIGSDVNVQVLGDDGLVLNVEGVLGQVVGRDGHPIRTGFTLAPDGGSFLWLQHEHHQRTIWADNAQTVLLIETQGLCVTVKREMPS